MNKYLNTVKMSLRGVRLPSRQVIDKAISRLPRSIVISLAMTIVILPNFCLAKPSVEEIKILNPQETYYATPFDRSLSDVEKKANSSFASQDIVSTFPDLELGLGGVVKVWRAPEYRIIDQSKETKIKSWGLSIKEVLDDGEVEIGEQDKVEPGLDQKISGAEEIKITRVAESQVKEEETIQYKTIEKNDANLERGKTEIVQQGKNGKREKVYLVRRENGEEVSRSLISNNIIDEAQNKIIHIGTKIVVLSSESGEASWTWGVTASRKYSRGTLIRVTNLSSGKSTETRVGGYGPMSYTGRILDLNINAWEEISSGGAGSGTMQVKVEELNE